MHDTLDLSPNAGDIWAGVPLPCMSFDLRAYHRFTGPWSGNTSHPLLWIGNTADPVTPVGSALKTSQGFPGSVVLTQNSPGHCSLAAFSECTLIYVKTYFQTGELPPDGTVCQPVVLPFGPSRGDTWQLTEELQLKADSHGSIGKELYNAGGGLMSGLVAHAHSALDQ